MTRTNAEGSSAGMYVDRAEGVSGTKLMAADRNAIEEELISAIEGGGLTPSGASTTQLLAAVRNIAIPVGYIYTQLPGMTAPATLWPWATWANESASFAGAFFRAEGGKATAFGAGKQGHAFQDHTHQRADAKRGDNDGSPTVPQWAGTGAPYQGTVSFGSPAEASGGVPQTADETRPDNYTVRVWRRTA